MGTCGFVDVVLFLFFFPPCLWATVNGGRGCVLPVYGWIWGRWGLFANSAGYFVLRLRFVCPVLFLCSLFGLCVLRGFAVTLCLRSRPNRSSCLRGEWTATGLPRRLSVFKPYAPRGFLRSAASAPRLPEFEPMQAPEKRQPRLLFLLVGSDAPGEISRAQKNVCSCSRLALDETVSKMDVLWMTCGG